MSDIAFLFRVAAFAAEKHRDQRRKDDAQTPYIGHPLEVARLIAEVGCVTDRNVLAAALLHDTVEDTETTIEELAAQFGDEIAGIVGEVTDDKSLPKPQRKQMQIDHAGSISSSAKLVKLADKISNVRDVRHSPPSGWSPERRREYFAWAELVIDQVRGTNAALEAAFDEALAERP